MPANPDDAASAWAKLAQTARRQGHPHRRARHPGRRVPKDTNEFVNTWSVDGFVSEGCQPAELGWGSHEKHFPARRRTARLRLGLRDLPDAARRRTRVRTWTPKAGHFHGFLITHGEAISIADYFTVKEGEQVVYRPTVHYAYHPCDDAVLSVHEFAGRNWRLQDRKRIMMDEITAGHRRARRAARRPQEERLLVRLAAVHRGGAEARAVQQRHQSAGHGRPCLSGMIWAMENPNRGIVEPDDMDFRRTLEICRPYLGRVVGEYTDWTPAASSAAAVPRRSRQHGSVAVQERAGGLSARAGRGRPQGRGP